MINRINNTKANIPIFLGRIDEWQDMVVDLSQTHHLLITGFIGCGKSTLIHNILSNLIISKDSASVRLLLFDTKGIELNIYNDSPHMLIPAITDITKLEVALSWCVEEVFTRLNLFASQTVRSIDEYNDSLSSSNILLPHIVLVLDGYLGEQENQNRLLEKLLIHGRTVGIHIILSTPTVQNIRKYVNLFPSLACFKSTSYPRNYEISSKLYSTLSAGEFCYKDQENLVPLKLCAPDVDFSSLSSDVSSLSSESSAEYLAELYNKIFPRPSTASDRDEYFEKAGRFILETGKASIGNLQRFFKIGFNRAARIMNQLEEAGIVSAASETRIREILITHEQFELLMQSPKPVQDTAVQESFCNYSECKIDTRIQENATETITIPDQPSTIVNTDVATEHPPVVVSSNSDTFLYMGLAKNNHIAPLYGKAVIKIVYCLLALFFGGIGAHKFYAGKTGAGIFYILFCWTGIPWVLSFIDLLIGLSKKSDEYGKIWI